ncbi:hypothetical protein ACFLSG_03700 [Candidatus Bipolaricaulota bacterium]
MKRVTRIGFLLGLAALGVLIIAGCTNLWTPSTQTRIWPRGLAEAEWIEDTGNPIFGEGVGGPKAYYPYVIYDKAGFSGHGTPALYKMWYGTSGSQTGLTTSSDGISWTNQGVVLSAGYHTTVKYDPSGFSGSGPNVSTMYYRAWYWNPSALYSVDALGYAESADGETWVNVQSCKNGAVPIVSSGDPWWNRGSYGPCDVLINPSATNTGTDWVFTLYYDGTTGGTEAIGVGFSSDGITWSGYDPDSDGKANPVLAGTNVAGDWDRSYVSRATILQADGGYEMWYSGGDGAVNHGIGYATSSDGLNWTRDDNPIFHKSDGVAWRDSRTYCPSVLSLNGGYVMWFSGKDTAAGDYSIGRATLASPTLPVDIDIKPGSDPNSINLGAKGVMPAAILGAEDFDVTDIDPTTVRLADAAPVRWNQADANGDNFVDLQFKFRIQELALTDESVEAALIGELWSGTAIEGVDSVRIVPKGKKP